MSIEEKVKGLILEKYGNMVTFANRIEMPAATLSTIMKRGLRNASVTSVIKICQELDISADELANDRIVFNHPEDIKDVTKLISYMKINASTYGLTLDEMPLSASETNAIMDALDLCINFIRRQRDEKS